MWLVVENKMAGTDSAECFICRSSPGAHLVVLEKSCEYNGQLIVEGEWRNRRKMLARYIYERKNIKGGKKRHAERQEQASVVSTTFMLFHALLTALWGTLYTMGRQYKKKLKLVSWAINYVIPALKRGLEGPSEIVCVVGCSSYPPICSILQAAKKNLINWPITLLHSKGYNDSFASFARAAQETALLFVWICWGFRMLTCVMVG